MPRFPHPHDDNFPFTPEHLFTGKREILIDVLIKLRQAFTFNRRLLYLLAESQNPVVTLRAT